MVLLQSIRMAVRSIMIKKSRAVLTILSIFIGVAAVIVLVSLQQANTDQWIEYMRNTGVNRIQVYASMWGGKDFTKELYDYCLSLTDLVEGVTPQQSMWPDNGIRYGAKTYQPQQIVFGSDQYGICSSSVIALGRDIAYMDVEKSNRVCVIGSAVKENLFNFKNPVGEKITVNNHPMTVIGVYEQKVDNSEWSDDNIVVVPYTLNRLLLNNTMIESFIVKAKDAASTVLAVEKLKGFLLTMYKNRSYAWYDVSSMNQFIEQTNEVERQNVLIRAAMAGLSLLVGGIGIMNIMLTTVTERTREIGIRKALGAERRSIIAQFLVEACIVSGLGGIVGVIVGILVTMSYIKIIQDKVFYPQYEVMAMAFGISVVIGILFGLYPAFKASKLQPVDALRTE
ncbi:MAG: ABC transporter permease [Oscillospiraceae bacterium]|nr:ABC transporter permease [Oscillospiraceae bacterium]